MVLADRLRCTSSADDVGGGGGGGGFFFSLNTTGGVELEELLCFGLGGGAVDGIVTSCSNLDGVVMGGSGGGGTCAK